MKETGILKKSLRNGVVLALLAVAFGAQAQSQPPLRVGAVLSLSGPAAPFGIPERDIIQILADQTNAAGGIKGQKIEVIFHDDQSNPTEAARGATRLVRQENVQVILGPTTGSSALAAAPVAAAASVPMLAPVGTISVTDSKQKFFPWTFRTAPSDRVSMVGLMDAGVFKSGHKRLAVFYQEDAYGKNAADFAAELAKEKNVEVVAMVGAPLTATDLTPVATKIRNANPDVLLLQTSAPALGAAFLRGARQVGLTVPIVGSPSLNQAPFIQAAGAAAEGVQLVSIGNWDDPVGKQVKLGELIRAAGKKPAGYAESIGSAAYMLMAEAARRAPTPATGTGLRDALETICGFDGTYLEGKICYSKDNHEGVGVDSMQKLVIKDGKFKTVR